MRATNLDFIKKDRELTEAKLKVDELNQNVKFLTKEIESLTQKNCTLSKRNSEVVYQFEDSQRENERLKNDL